MYFKTVTGYFLRFTKESQSLENSSLLKNLSEINNNLKSKHVVTKASTKQVLNIAIRDISGAYAGGRGGAKVGTYVGTMLGNPATGAVFGAAIGAIAFGAFSSWLACPESIYAETPEYKDICQLLNQCSFICDDSGNLTFSITSPEILKETTIDESILETVNLSESSLVIGRAHNAMLTSFENLQILNTKSNSYVSYSEPLFWDITNSNEMEALFNDLKSGKCKDNTLPSAVINLFLSIYSTYPENEIDVVDLINQYTLIVSNSDELNSEEKEWIKMGLSTSLYSYSYWSKRINDE